MYASADNPGEMYGAVAASPGEERAAGARRVRVLVAALLYAAFVGLCAGTMIRAAGPPLELSAAAPAAARASSIGSVASSPAQISDNSTCAALGFSDAQLLAHRRALALPNTYGGDALENVFLPVFASHNFSSVAVADARVTRAVVFLHGVDGEANAAYCKALAAASEHGGAERTLIVAPWFGDEQVSLSAWSSSSSGGGLSAYWQNFSWIEGADAASPPLRYTTAFDALDSLIVALNRTAGGAFPNLERVVVVGFSAGAQLGVRHAFFSGRPALTARYVLSDASDWLYFSSDRPAAACRALRDTGAEHTCARFTPPPTGSCESFDDYKYGIDALSKSKSRSMYLASFDDSLVFDAVDRWFSGALDIRYLFGTADVCDCSAAGYENAAMCYPTPSAATSCAPDSEGGADAQTGVACCDTYPDSTTRNWLDTDCAAMLQGSNRLQRGLNYVGYLGALARNRTSAWRPKYGLFDGAHDAAAFYAAPLFADWVFDAD